MLIACRSTLDFGDVFVGVPYSEQACRDAAVALGLKLGYRSAFHVRDFVKNNSYPKGCYAYNASIYRGSAFYSTGGTVEQMKKDVGPSAYRPENYDCAAGNFSMHVCVCSFGCMCMYRPS